MTAYLYEVEAATVLSVKDVDPEATDVEITVQSPTVFGPLLPPVVEYTPWLLSVGAGADAFVVLKTNVFWMFVAPVPESEPFVQLNPTELDVIEPLVKEVAALGEVISVVDDDDVYIMTSSKYNIVDPERLLEFMRHEKFCAEPEVF